MAFAAMVVLSIAIFWHALQVLVLFSLSRESSSHIALIPLVSIYLLYTERLRVFQIVRTGSVLGGVVALAAIVLYLFVWRRWPIQDPEQFLPGAALAIVFFWFGGFLLCYGGDAWRRASFELLFLLLMIPLPSPILERTIYYLQQGSTEIAFLLFKAFGVPVLRQGFILSVPGVTIEVAKECSGIRSSMALLITCLLAAHLFLSTTWKKLVFVLLAVPLGIIKNGIRITTLTLLSIYVDPSFLHGNLHRDGGFVFFFLALAILAPVLIAFQRSDERKLGRNGQVVPPETDSGLVPG